MPSPQQRRSTDPGDAEHGSHPRRHRFDVVEGSVRIYVQSMFGGPGRRLSSAATMTRYWSLSSAWHRRCVAMLCGRRRS